MLTVIHQFVGKENIIVNTADKECSKGHNKDELPIRTKRKKLGAFYFLPLQRTWDNRRYQGSILELSRKIETGLNYSTEIIGTEH